MIKHLPILLIALPLLAAFLIPLIDRFSKIIRNLVCLLLASFNTITSFIVSSQVYKNGTITYVFGGEKTTILMPSGNIIPIRIMLTIDGFGILIAISCSLVMLAIVIYSMRFMKEPRLGKYYSLLMLVLASINGLVLTGDLFNLFVFLEILSLSSAGLIAFWRQDDEAPEAAFKYLVISSIATLFVLLAIAIFYGQYGALNLAALSKLIEYNFFDKIALGILIVGFAMKCGAVPMHMWVPDTYSRSPASISAMFVIVTQISLYALIRTVFTLFGIKLNLFITGWVMIILGILSMVVGILMALPQKDIKRLMAFHAISQTGYMLLGVGVGLAVLSNPGALNSYGIDAMNGGIFHIINHALYKGLLFLTAGAIFYSTGKQNMNEMGGLAKKMPLTAVLFVVGALAIAGMPPFNGFASKFLLYESVFKFNPLLSIIAMVVSILTLASFMKVFYSAFLRSSKIEPNIREVPRPMLIGMMLLGALIIIIGLFPGYVVEHFIQPATSALLNQAAYQGAVLP